MKSPVEEVNLSNLGAETAPPRSATEGSPEALGLTVIECMGLN